VKHRRAERRTKAGLLCTIFREGDAVAEALIAHAECCNLRHSALLLLAIAGLSEEEFLRRWAAGEGSDKP
jgi:hypothetical protein